MNVAETIALFESPGYGYKHVRQLPSGEYIGVLRMIFTWGVCLMTIHGPRTRFCYETEAEAVEAAKTWDGEGWPPGYWIKQKPEGTPNPKKKEKT